MTAPFSGHCETAPLQPQPLEAHRRCKLEGCVCSCHSRPKVPLACLQGRHTTSCDHLTLYGVPVVEDATMSPDAPPRVVTTEDFQRRLDALGVVDPHLWPPITFGGRRNGKTAAAEAFDGLTDDEKVRVIAAHLEYRPDAILETVAAIVAERMGQ